MPAKLAQQLKDDLSEILQRELYLSKDEVERLFNVNAVDLRYGPVSYGKLILHQLAAKAAKGDMKAINQVLDRLVGKPVQQNENVNVDIGYAEYLDSLDDDKIIDAEVTETPALEYSKKEKDLVKEFFG